jgi:hypothetical protein
LTRVSSQEEDNEGEERPNTSGSSSLDPKMTQRIRPTDAQVLRYRRRCAPVLLAASPRVSDVVFYEGKRLRINVKEHILVDYVAHPPRYDAHNFPRSKRVLKPMPVRTPTRLPAGEKVVPSTLPTVRPTSPIRNISDDSINSISFEEDVAAAHPASLGGDSGSSTPPSPTAISHTKADAQRQLAHMGKRRTSEDSRENGLSAVALGVGLII